VFDASVAEWRLKNRPYDLQLHDLFLTDFKSVPQHAYGAVFADDTRTISVQYGIHVDLALRSKFLTFYIDRQDQHTAGTCTWLAEQYQFILDNAPQLLVEQKQPGDSGTTSTKESVFSNRIYIYHETYLPAETTVNVTKIHSQRGISVILRSTDYLSHKKMEAEVIRLSAEAVSPMPAYHQDKGAIPANAPVSTPTTFNPSADNPEVPQRVGGLPEQSTIEIDTESKERVLVGEVISTVALAGHISREFNVSDQGIDMEIEFKSDAGEATGQKLYLQLKSGDSYLRQRQRDDAEVFTIRDERHVRYWMAQKFPVMLVIRTSEGEVRWMEVRDWLKRASGKSEKPVKQIIFEGERFDVMSVRRWREKVLGRHGGFDAGED